MQAPVHPLLLPVGHEQAPENTHVHESGRIHVVLEHNLRCFVLLLFRLRVLAVVLTVFVRVVLVAVTPRPLLPVERLYLVKVKLGRGLMALGQNRMVPISSAMQGLLVQ